MKKIQSLRDCPARRLAMLVGGCVLLLLSYPTLVHSKSDVELERIAEAWPAPLEADTTTLVYVQVAWRHGDRTPAIPVPFSDANKWSEGLGELTKKGIAQQYRLGKWLRARYGRFLGDHFDRHQVFVRSSDYNRTLMSAQANMAGLFPPSKSEMWETGLAWQPVPVHSFPKSIDKELYEDIECPTASAEFRKVWKSGVVTKMESENEDLILFLREHSRIPNFQFYMLWMIYDNLFCMLQHNDTHVWPSWMNSSLFSRVQKLYDASSRMKYHTEVLRRLRGGPLLKDIVDRFLAKRDGVLGERPKLYAYSAHDTTLAAMLSTLGIYPAEFPRYATAVLLELHKRDGKLVIEVYHKNMTDVDTVYRYLIPGCSVPCTLEALQSTVERYLPGDWTAECGLAGPDAVNYMISTAVFACTTLLLAGFLALDVTLKRKRRSTSASEPLMIDDEEA